MSEFEWVLRRAEAGSFDGEQFCALFNSLYRRKVNYDYYRWQFFETPHPTVLAMAFSPNGRLIGCYGFHVIETVGVDKPIAWALDIMIAPEFQRQNLFRKLAEFAEKQVTPFQPAALCVMANERADVVHVHGLGWHRVSIFTTWACATRSYSGAPSRLEFVRVARIPQIAHRQPDLQPCRLRDRRLVTTRREPGHLNWRFTTNPWHRYTSFVAHRNGEWFGYLIMKIFRDPDSEQSYGDIVDVFWLKDDPDLLAEMLEFALADFHQQGIVLGTIWLQTNTLLDQIGRETGFMETNQRRYFCCKVLGNEYSALNEPEQWSLTMADSEIY